MPYPGLPTVAFPIGVNVYRAGLSHSPRTRRKPHREPPTGLSAFFLGALGTKCVFENFISLPRGDPGAPHGRILRESSLPDRQMSAGRTRNTHRNWRTPSLPPGRRGAPGIDRQPFCRSACSSNTHEDLHGICCRNRPVPVGGRRSSRIRRRDNVWSWKCWSRQAPQKRKRGSTFRTIPFGDETTRRTHPGAQICDRAN